jgi:hypothetical protein
MKIIIINTDMEKETMIILSRNNPIVTATVVEESTAMYFILAP